MTMTEILELSRAGFTKADILAMTVAKAPEVVKEPEKAKEPEQAKTPEPTNDTLTAMQNSITQLTQIITDMQKDALGVDRSGGKQPDDITNIIAQMVGATAPEGVK